MNNYTIEITEVLQRQINIKADSKEDALRIVRELYFNEEIILDDSDYIDTDIHIKG